MSRVKTTIASISAAAAFSVLGADAVLAQADCTAVEPVRCFAVSETSEAGTLVSGDFRDTDLDDGVYEVLSEADETIGPPPKRADELRHSWTVEVLPGNSYRFSLDAYRLDTGGDGDDFDFLSSTDGGQTWSLMVTVASDTAALYTHDFSGDVAGTLLVRAEDTDRSKANKNNASLFVDALYVGISNEDPPDPPQISERNVIGYFTSWSIYARDYFVNEHEPGVDHLPGDKLTHINYAFADTEPDGTVIIGDSFADTGKAFGNEPPGAPFKGNFQQLQILKQSQPHLKTLISIGGWTWSDHFSDIMADDSVSGARDTFCDSMLDFVQTYGFDGADIDWEYPGDPGEGDNSFRDPAVDSRNFVDMLANCKPLFEAQNKLLTVATPCNPALYEIEMAGGGRYLEELALNVDWVNLLSYDLHGAFDPVTGHHGQLFLNPADPLNPRFTVDACVQGHIAEGVPAAKIHPGVPIYGRAYGKVTPGGNGGIPGLFQPFAGVPKGTWDGGRWGITGVFDYEDILLNILPGATQTHDIQAEAPSLVWNLGGNKGMGFLSYDDQTSVCAKVDYVESEGLAGLMTWELSGDIENHPESLVAAMFCGFNPTAPNCAADPCP